MRIRLLMLMILFGIATTSSAQVSIGINFSLFPDLVRVPDYPVYYAPRANANYFFYDGMYWVYQNDDWYSSDWYNGPWYRVAPEFVPLYILRVPVRYYRRPPAYFRGWGRDAPPRWGEHWGRDWQQQHNGWDRWNRRAAPAPAPLPAYQRQYTGNRYPRPEEQHVIHDQKYRYQPRDAMVRDHVRPEVRQGAGAPAAAAREQRPETPRKDAGKDARERDQRPTPAPAQKPAPSRPQPPQGAPAATPRDHQPDERKDHRQDTRERDQKSTPARPPQPAVPAPRPQATPAPVPRERSPEARKDERPAAREREQQRPAVQQHRPPPQAAPVREAPPRPAAPSAPPPRPAAPPPPPKPAAAPRPPPQPHPAPAGKGPERENEKK